MWVRIYNPVKYLGDSWEGGGKTFSVVILLLHLGLFRKRTKEGTWQVRARSTRSDWGGTFSQVEVKKQHVYAEKANCVVMIWERQHAVACSPQFTCADEGLEAAQA